MARPAVAAEDRLTGHLRARCTKAEEATIAAKALANGLTESEYVRRAALRAKITVTQRRAPDLATASELKRIGNNLNQLVALFHTGEKPVPGALERVWDKLETVLDRIIRDME